MRLPSAARWREGRQGAARPASPLRNSSSSLLLANANTALFFPERANAPGTQAATHGAPAERATSSGKAPGVQAAPGQIPKMALHAGGARLAAEAANVPCAALGPPKAPAAGKSGVPTRGGGRRGAGGRAAASRAFPQRRQQRPPARPPAGSGRGTFPAWSRAKEPRNGAGGWRGFERSERNTRGVQLGGRGERQSGGTRRPGKSEESRGPARSQPEARAVSRRDGSGMESWGPMGKRGRTAAPGEGRKDPQVTGTTASLGGSGRFEVPSVLPSPNSPAPRPHLRPLRTPRHAGGEGVDAGIPEGSRHSRPAAEKRSRPLAPAEFP